MDKDKAIKLIMAQLEKLNSHLSLDVWKNQTASYVKDIFGEQSEEYKWITDCKLPRYFDREQKPSAEKTFRDKCLLFLVECINTINQKGIYQKPNTNFIQRLDNSTIIAISIFLAGALFVGGVQWGIRTSDVQNIRLEERNELLVKENNALQEKITSLEKKVQELLEKVE